MSGAGLDSNTFKQVGAFAGAPRSANGQVQSVELGSADDRSKLELRIGSEGPRRTPRRSLIVVLPENHSVAPDRITEHLIGSDQEIVDVIVACAGPPSGLAALQKRIRDIQILIAPAGTSVEDLRELAMKESPGDIVTLLSGTLSSYD